MTIGLQQDDNQVQFCKLLILLLESLLMTSTQAGAQIPAPLRGPDFVLEKVVSWKERPGADSELVLGDGSAWKLKPGTKTYQTQRDRVSSAMRRDTDLFVSGDKNRGTVEIIINAQRLAAEEISSTQTNGRYAVGFQGPPSVYHLRMDRPWSSQALLLLQQSASSGASFSSPDLLVAIDPITLEIMAVRPLASGKATTIR